MDEVNLLFKIVVVVTIQKGISPDLTYSVLFYIETWYKLFSPFLYHMIDIRLFDSHLFKI